MTQTAGHSSATETSGKTSAPIEKPNVLTGLPNEGGKAKRENVREKSKRLLLAGRLRVVKVDGNLIVAECRGDSGEVYNLGHEPGAVRPWRCTCQAIGPCSHLHALWAVTAVTR